MATLYVWDARLDVEWEPAYELGLYFKKANAKAACQKHAENHRLRWDDSDRKYSRADSKHANEWYTVTRVPVN